jgi:hypothetical protein
MKLTVSNDNKSPHFAPCATPPYFAADDDDAWCLETGRPGIGLFANAVQIWALLQEREVTIAEAARAFNVPEAMIRTAVEWHPWMLIEAGDIIGHDGE